MDAFNPEGSELDANSPSTTLPTELTQMSQSAASESPTPNCPPIPRQHSVSHHVITDKKAWFLSLDVETSGERAGIIQISGEIAHIYHKSDGKSPAKDTVNEVYPEP